MTFIRIVIFLLIIIISTDSTPTEAHECENVVPFLQKTFSGIDITKLDIIPVHGSNSNWDGFVDNVFHFNSCNRRCKWFDQWLNNVTYDVPDEYCGHIDYPLMTFGYDGISIDHTVLDAKWSRAMTISPFNRNDQLDQKTEIVNVVNDAQITRLFFQSRKYQSLVKQYYESGKITAWIASSPNFLDLYSQNPRDYLSSEFVGFIKQKLPPKYEDNPTVYQEFVQRFGTHYFDYGFFGPYHYLQVAIDRQYALKHSDDQIVRNLKVAFDREFNIDNKFDGKDIENETTTAQVDEDFRKNSELIASYGGKVSKWVDKVSGKTFVAQNNSDRVMLGAYLEDLALLIENETIRDQVWIATRMYTIKAYLGELASVYNYTSYQLSEEENEKLKQVKAMIDSNNFAKMDQMDEIINHLYDKVLTFTDRKYCYPALYDLYVTANLKLDFAKNLCPQTRGKFFRPTPKQCVSGDIYREQKDVSELFSLYENETQGLNCMKEVRSLNLEYQIQKDRDHGLGAICVKCN